MKTFLLSFALTLCAVLSLAHSWRNRGGAVAPADSPDRPRAGDPAGRQSSAPGNHSGTPAVVTPAMETPESAPDRPDLIAKVREAAAKKPTGGEIPKWWDAICDLAELDPILAIQMLREAPPGFARSHALSGSEVSILAWWAAKNPDAALAWYWQEKSTEKRSAPFPEELAQTLASRNPGRAIQFTKRWLGTHDGNVGYGASMDGLYSKLIVEVNSVAASLWPFLKTPDDFDSLAALARGLDIPEMRAGIWQSLATAFLKYSTPEAARSFFDKHPMPQDWPDGFLHPAMPVMVKALQTDQEPGPWADWALRTVGSRTDAQAQVAVRLMSGWGKKDPQAAGHWLQSFSEHFPAAAPLAMRAYADAALNEDPTAAMAWVSAIPEERTRRQAMILLFPNWAAKDALAAAAWLESSPWPPEIKRLLAGAFQASALQ